MNISEIASALYGITPSIESTLQAGSNTLGAAKNITARAFQTASYVYENYSPEQEQIKEVLLVAFNALASLAEATANGTTYLYEHTPSIETLQNGTLTGYQKVAEYASLVLNILPSNEQVQWAHEKLIDALTALHEAGSILYNGMPSIEQNIKEISIHIQFIIEIFAVIFNQLGSIFQYLPTLETPEVSLTSIAQTLVDKESLLHGLNIICILACLPFILKGVALPSDGLFQSFSNRLIFTSQTAITSLAAGNILFEEGPLSTIGWMLSTLALALVPNIVRDILWGDQEGRTPFGDLYNRITYAISTMLVALALSNLNAADSNAQANQVEIG